ncbi:hypothetical protein AB6D11_18540 [Vibrio splendidus]
MSGSISLELSKAITQSKLTPSQIAELEGEAAFSEEVHGGVTLMTTEFYDCKTLDTIVELTKVLDDSHIPYSLFYSQMGEGRDESGAEHVRYLDGERYTVTVEGNHGVPHLSLTELMDALSVDTHTLLAHIDEANKEHQKADWALQESRMNITEPLSDPEPVSDTDSVFEVTTSSMTQISVRAEEFSKISEQYMLLINFNKSMNPELEGVLEVDEDNHAALVEIIQGATVDNLPLGTSLFYVK